MAGLTQKWVFVAQIEYKNDGFEFFWKDWPLHVTIASTFALDEKPKDIFKEVEKVLSGQKAFEVEVIDEVSWGKTVAMLLEQNNEIMDLHNKVYTRLISLGVVFNEPQYVGAGYVPHSTAQKHSRLQINDIVKINNISLVNMFPNGDGYQRKILKTMHFI